MEGLYYFSGKVAYYHELLDISPLGAKVSLASSDPSLEMLDV